MPLFEGFAGGIFMKHIKMFRAALAAFVMVFVTCNIQAADIFVSPTGSGEKTGANWSNALNGSNDGWHIDVKNAITAAVASEAEEVNVYLAAGDYTVTNQLALSSITIPVKFSGGYVGATDGSFAKSEELKTTLKRSTYNSRFLYGSSLSNLTIDSMVFSDGKIKGADEGGAIKLVSSNTMIISSEFLRNSVEKASSYQRPKGGAIGVNGGSLSVLKSSFLSNSLVSTYATTWGGAIFTLKANLAIRDCMFSGNKAGAANYGGIGGAICANGYEVSIVNCIFENNLAYTNSGTGTGIPTGGALAIRSATYFKMEDCVLTNNYSKVTNKTRTSPVIAGLYLDDLYKTDGVMTAAVTRCVFDSFRVSKNGNYTKSDIVLNCGYLFMTNCLVAGASGTHSDMTNSVRVIRASSPSKSDFNDLQRGGSSADSVVCPSHAELVNCTIVDGVGAGVVAIGDATISIKNSIIQGHTVTSVINPTSVEYCCLQEEHEGEGNFVPESEEALNWTGAPYYHLLTKKSDGAITNGWFSGTFESAKTAADSPCIDAGAPGSVGLDLEPYYSGRRVNIGAYGGTPWASKTSLLPGFKLIIR